MASDFGRAGTAFANYLVKKICKCGSGSGPDGEYVSPDRPRDRFFVGRLSPGGQIDPAQEILDSAEDFYARLNPCSMRVRFLLSGSKATEITVQPSFKIFARVFPEYDRQFKDAELSFARGVDATIMPSFRRLEPHVLPLKFSLVDLQTRPTEVTVEWDKDSIANLPNLYLGQSDRKISKAQLFSPDAYATFLGGISGDPAVPEIKVSLIAAAVQVKGTQPVWEVSLALVNRSLDSDPAGIKRLREEVIFDVSLDSTIEGGVIVPYEFPSLPKSYRFDRRMYGTGVNCAVTAEGPDPQRPNVLRTSAVPTYEQKRFFHRKLPGISITFENLGGTGAVTTLQRIASEMRNFDKTEWEKKSLELGGVPMENDYNVSEFREDRDLYGKEIERFEKGIECLSVPNAARAFSLMNQAFQLLGGEKRDRWYLFQIVFIVSMLPAIVGREHPELSDLDEWEVTDVVWFPTGGGKTEAYLGLTVFALFFDRLRGKQRGVTAMYRFPLRLLSLQQFQRIVRTIAAANRIKARAAVDGEPFTVGHWIGAHGSPNQIKADEVDQVVEDEKRIVDGVSVLTRKYRKISECPNPGCGDRGIYLHFDMGKWALQHVCPKCGVLPVYIVDNELYRYLPGVIVATVDKMAIFGLQRRFVNLMGWTRGYCPDHGYAPEEECEICRKKNLKALPIKDPVPALHVQDELHLLKEDLGAFDSHYETAVMGLQKAVPGSQRPWKTIAATATIEEFQRHVEHLYLKRGRRFPTSGPSYEKTFFAETDPTLVSRLFAGVVPSGLTHINAMVSLLWYYHREIAELRELDPVRFLGVTGLQACLEPEYVPQFLSQYEINLTYVLTKKAADQMAESLDAQIGNYLMDQGLPELVSEVLSGGTTSDKITEVMDRIERFDLEEPNSSKRIRSVVATSMISHGVDVERFNFITFFGMPRMTSEYIQASSRVGRNFPGIVLICFAPARERDRSHYHFFHKYHEYLERLVEPAAINRWSRFSIEKTIPGIVIGSIVNEAARTMGKKLTTGRAIRSQVPHNLDDSLLRKRIEEYYGADRQSSKEFSEFISTRVAQFFFGLPDSNAYIGQRRGWKPMRSLRDTDQEVKFRPSKKAAPLFELLLKDRIATGDIEFRGETEAEDND